MSDYFLLDPDYKDFDFPDKHKLKFKTVYGEQHGRLADALLILILSSIFLLITLASCYLSSTYWWNSEKTFGVVTQPCQALQDNYVYSFEAKDKTGNMRHFTGTTTIDRYRSCRNVGDSIEVEYIRDNPDLSHETRGELSTLTTVCAISFTFIFCAFFAYSSVHNIRAFRQARPKYALLKEQGFILIGKITDVEKASNTWGPKGYYIKAEYEFRHNGQLFSGVQIKRCDDLKGKPLPQYGTPVRILYADENTYVML